MNPQDVQSSLIETLDDAIDGFHLYDHEPAQIIPPAIFVSLLSLTPSATFDPASADAVFLVQVVVGAVAEKGAQAKLYEFISPGSSVLGALQADPTLSGAVQSSKIGEISIAARVAPDGGTRYWSANIPVEVHSIA